MEDILLELNEGHTWEHYVHSLMQASFSGTTSLLLGNPVYLDASKIAK
uniref:Uncharacterized protein n=1 Tax=Moniliophthora roreri TaxID=221103 RepID=A0A0W0FSI7_MONRR